MFPTLLRRLGLLPRLVLLLLALGGTRPALATHLLGGEMTYRYLDANGPAAARLRYEITVTIYNNTNTGAAPPNTDAPVGIYDLATGTKINLVQGVNVLAGSGATVPTNGNLAGVMDITNYTISPNLNPGTLAGCPAAGVTQTFRLQKFVAIVNLPANAGGYYALFTRSARNVDVKNLNTAGNNQSLMLYSALSPPLLPNRSPVFSDTAVAVVCQGDTTIVLNNAADPDGDRLVYAFGQPYGNTAANGVLPGAFPLSYATTPPTPSLPTVPYYGGAGYSVSTPFGTAAGNYASLNASTGTAKYRAAAGTAGAKYVVAVDVSEYRTINGREVLIGTTRRDLQLLVGDCPATATPVLPLAAATPRSYTIEEGSSLSIPLTVTQANGHALTLTLNSVLLDGAGGFNTTFNGSAGTVVPGNVTGTATASGTGGRVSGTFVYNSVCGEARATPYDVAFTAKDLACGGKLVADVLRITVTRPSGPTAISGDAVVCNLNTVSTYQASGGTAPTVRWRVVGGTIVGSNTGRSVQVRWATAGAGTLVAKGISTYGCLTDSVSQAVTVAPAGVLTITGGGSVCLGTSATLAVAGGGAPYTLTDGSGNTQTGPGPFIVTPTATTTYTITSGVAVLGCTASQQATVTVLPLPVAAVGLPTRATCTGVPISLGAAPVAGFTYSWSPATGFSSATVANPTLTLTNPTGAPVTTTYTLTVTNTATGCVGTGTVAVTVNPGATAAAGPAQAVCAGSTITLGTAALPGYTYQWTPATGLNSSTVAQPVLTGVNPTNAPIIQKYVVLATTALGCSSKDSVLITINPRPAADTITGPTSVCPTVTGIVYSIKNPRNPAYQWAVTGGTLVSGQGSASITVNWGAAGTGSVSAVATNALGCAADAFVLPVRINQQLQTAKPTGPTSVCQADGPYTYQTPLANGSSYSWQLFGTAQGTLTNTSNTTSIRFTTAGLAKLVVTETSNPAGGICRGVSDTLYITVKPSPLASLSIQGPARFCVNSGPQTYTLAGFSGSTYVFQLNGTTIANTNGTVVIPASTAVGTYTLTARETSAGGCVGPLYTRTFTVDPLPAAVTISGPRFVCPATRTLTYTVANALASSTFQWTVTGATITAGQGTATITVGFPAAPSTSNATVSVVETSQYGCGGPLASLTVVPDNANPPLFTLASVVATDNTKVTLTFSVASPGTTPNPVRVLRREAGSTSAYTQVGTVAATATTFVDATANAATTSYQYTLALTNGCGDVLPGVGSHTTVLLKAVAVPGPGGRNQGSTRLSWTAYQGFAVAGYRVYQQADNGGYQLLSTVSGSTLQADVPNTVQASSGTGFNLCYRVVAFEGGATPGTPLHESNSNTSCVDFANKTAFYNVITPNGDGQNDVLIIDNVQLYPGSSLAIFNRWGREVYRTTGYNNTTVAWGTDPTIAAGVYYYLFKLADGTSTKGWVEVVK